MSEILIRVVVLAIIFGGAALLRQLSRRKKPQSASAKLLVPSLPEKMPDWAEPDKIAFVQRQIESLGQVPWGQEPERDPQQAQALYERGLAITYEAGGEFGKLRGAIDAFVHCPRPLALTGAADVMMRLAYVSGSNYIPQGIQEAVRYTSEALKLNPKQVEAWLVRARIATLVQGDVGVGIAKQALDEARKLNPNPARLAIAEASYFRRIKDNAQRIVALQRALVSGQLTAPERMGALDGLAFALWDNGKLDEALTIFDQENAEFPNSAWGWHNASIAYDNAERHAEALARSDRALTFFEFGVARNFNRLLRLKLGLPVPELERPQDDEDRENFAKLRVSYANWLKKQGVVRYREAEQQFLLALQLQPDRAETHYQHGIFYEDQTEQFDRARAEYLDTLRLTPDRVAVRFRLANMLAKLGPQTAAEAEAEYQAILTKNAAYYDVHREYGRFLMAQGPARWDEAEREVRAALKMRPNDEASNKLLFELQEARRQAGFSTSQS